MKVSTVPVNMTSFQFSDAFLHGSNSFSGPSDRSQYSYSNSISHTPESKSYGSSAASLLIAKNNPGMFEICSNTFGISSFNPTYSHTSPSQIKTKSRSNTDPWNDPSTPLPQNQSYPDTFAFDTALLADELSQQINLARNPSLPLHLNHTRSLNLTHSQTLQTKAHSTMSQSIPVTITINPVLPSSVSADPSCPDIEQEITAQNLYKTELCRSFEETGACRYGLKCQFAHGIEEVRPVLRHPKYKTEICKTFHTVGTCPYGKRCRFIHTRAKNMDKNQTFSQSNSRRFVNKYLEKVDSNEKLRSVSVGNMFDQLDNNPYGYFHTNTPSQFPRNKAFNPPLIVSNVSDDNVSDDNVSEQDLPSSVTSSAPTSTGVSPVKHDNDPHISQSAPQASLEIFEQFKRATFPDVPNILDES